VENGNGRRWGSPWCLDLESSYWCEARKLL
jgi:hypothetical protein